MRPAEPRTPLSHALALGLVQGPAELLPVSSSAHTTLLRPPHAEHGKSFDLALHAGSGLALAVFGGELRGRSRVSLPVLAAALAPPALAGVALRGTVEQRLGGPRQLAVGLAAGGVAMGLADRRKGSRRADDAGLRDGLVIGAAQAIALVPGVSRNGATLAAARALGFERPAAQSLSWQAGLPLMLAAGVAEAARLPASGRSDRAALAGGGLAALASGAVAARLLGPRLRDAPLAPFALYRLSMATFVFARLRRAQ